MFYIFTFDSKESHPIFLLHKLQIMITIHELPALRLLLSLVIGIICAPLIDINDPSLQVNLISVSVGMIATLFLINLKFKLRYLSTIFQLLIGVLVTIVVITLTDPRNSPTHITAFSPIINNSKIEVLAICSDPVSKKNSYQIPIDLIAIRPYSDKEYNVATGKVVIYAKSLTKLPMPGDKIKFSTILKDPDTQINPNAFDFGQYLKRQGIYKIGYVKSDDIEIIEPCRGFNIKNITLRMRDWLLERSCMLIGDNEIADVSAGLLFGYRDKIDEETNQQFINSGAVHLLAVSGMHVILIFTNIRSLLRRMRLHKLLSDNWVSIISILMIWIFSFLVGLAASIVRATIMLTLLIFGEIFKKQTNSLNIVCAGAVLMLIYDPMTLWDVGFQLSFAAVIGIIQLQKAVRECLPAIICRSKILTDLITVTFAAQLGTLPLILYYFHQFPIYFLITGIVAVVISDWIIKIGFVIILISLIYYPLAEYFSLAWYGATFALVKSIELINKLPFVLIERIYFDIPMALITSIMILIIIIHQNIMFKRIRSFLIAASILLLVLDFRSIWKNQDVGRITQYHNKKYRMIEIQNGLNSIVIADEDISDKSITNSVLGNQVTNNIKESKIIRVKAGEDCRFSFEGKEYLLPANKDHINVPEDVIVIGLPEKNE